MTHSTFVRLCRARDRLREAHEERIPIRAIAHEAAMSPYHFIRLFEHLFGATPHQYRIRARIDRAKELLALSDRSITDVCLDVGCESLGSFTDFFTRRVGVPPSTYRRQIRLAMPAPRRLPPAEIPGCLTLMAAAFATFEKRRPLARARL